VFQTFQPVPLLPIIAKPIDMARAPSGATPPRGAALSALVHLLALLQTATALGRVAKGLRRQERRAGPGRGGHNTVGPRHVYSFHASPGLHQTLWYGKLLSKSELLEDPTSREHKEFVKEFRVPYQLFRHILQECRLQQWAKPPSSPSKKRRGRPPCPLEYKVLSCLYRLGSGCLNRTTARMFNMCPSSTDVFFKNFTAWYAQYYDTECRAPATLDEIRDVEKVYAKMGFPGCVGSVDGVHVSWSKCPAGLLTRHKGAKGHPTRSFNVTVDHRRMIQRVACSKPGAFNDVTSVRYDPHVTGMQNGLYSDYEYKVCGEVTKGAYLLADGGYLRWRCLQCPRNHDSRQFVRQWSSALESVRKDVECTFGILKGRFRILKVPFDFEHETHIDNVFYTCCVLHNQIQRSQGFADVWREEHDWRGMMGCLPESARGVRKVGVGQHLRVYANTDTSYVGGLWGALGVDDDADEVHQWTALGEGLAMHYADMRRRKRLMVPKSQRWCALRAS